VGCTQKPPRALAIARALSLRGATSTASRTACNGFESSPGLDLEQSEARLLAQVALKILNGVGA
jgi:hypothetical protein